jgi:ribosome-binding protein aMBF1 (putative translation factor)
LWHIRQGSFFRVSEKQGGGEEVPIRKQFGDRVRLMREQRHWSKVELAEKASIHPQTIMRIEDGLHSPTIETVEKIAKAFECRLSFMLACEGHGKHVDEHCILEQLRSADESKRKAAWAIISILLNM